MIIKKISNKLVSTIKSVSYTFITFFNKILGRSDYSRWKKKESLFSSWEERTELLAFKIQPNTRVFEFGAGRLALKHMLPEGCDYLHSDLVSRAKDTLVVDLNKEFPDIPEVDYVVFSGVLEYVNDIDKLITHLATKTSFFLFSYATCDKYDSINFRRSQGWVSDLSHHDFQQISKRIDADLEEIGLWRNQTLYLLHN